MMNGEDTVAQEVALVARASGGDRDAMAKLYDRYFDRIYDFVHRMMRDADETADVVQDVFMKAMSAMGSLKKGERFRSWLFSIAHNMTLNRIDKQKRIVRPREDKDDEEPYIYQQIDTDRLADPEAALVDGETAALVWEAAAGLDRKQYAILDLHVRQGLDSAEIAEVLGVSKGNAYTMVSRMKSSVEESITAFLMVRRGSEDCPALNELIVDARAGVMTPELRRLVTRHISECDICSENKKRIASPLAVLGAFAAVPPPLGLKEGIFQNISGSSGGPPTGDGGGGAEASRGGMSAGRKALPGRLLRAGRERIAALPRGQLVLLAAAGVIGFGGAIIVGSLALFGAFSGDGGSAVLGVPVTPTATVTVTPRPGPLSGDATVTPTPTPTPNPSSVSQPPLTPTPSLVVSDVSEQPTPAPTAPPTAAPTPTPTDTTGPRISGLTVSPAAIGEDVPGICSDSPMTATVTATITDSSGVGSVTMSWAVGDIPGGPEPMSAEEGSVYSAKVGPFSEETVAFPDESATVDIVVKATDSKGNSATAKTSLTLYDCTFF